MRALVVERLAGDEIDGGAERTFVGVGGCGLAHLQRAEQVGGEYVEVEAAAAVGRGARIAGGGGRQRLEAVEAHAREIAAQAAHRDAASFAVVAVERDAGQALQGLGQVGVGEVGDVLGVDGVHHHVGVLLDVDGVAQRHAVTGYLDLADLLGRVVRGAVCAASAPAAASVLIRAAIAVPTPERAEHQRQNALGAI